MDNAISPSLTLPQGFRAAGGTCGIKKSGSPDLMLLVADQPCAAAAVFTTNKMPGAPVIVSKRHIRRGIARAIVCNSGCSNVATGASGVRDATTMCSRVSRLIRCDRRDVLVCSTGVIGQPLPMEKITRGIDLLAGKLARGQEADADATRAIMTTDLKPKSAVRRIRIGDADVTLAGIAKGSGMIAPNMATMLAFITTDADLSSPLLRIALTDAANRSFNRISVDEDTSTSDSVMLLASGLAPHPPITSLGPDFSIFQEALTALCQDLAIQIVADGEGATKVFQVAIRGARHERDADRVGRTVVGSPLVKTAVHGGDPNWGRLIMAVGRSGAAVRPEALNIAVGDITVLHKGERADLTPEQAAALGHLMKQSRITFHIDMGIGDGEADWWGCDLSREYITINADYTT